jgi:hypothetical protein
MNWVDPTLGWFDRSYDPAHVQLQLTPYLDMFHPAFQEYLVGFLTDLSDAGIDGVLFRNDAPLGPHDGFSPFALKGFERDFQVQADPVKLLPMSVSGFSALSREPQKDQAGMKAPPEYWQWTGWKARERMKVMSRLRKAMLSHAPALQFSAEFHPEAVTDPVTALVQYGEDLLEAKRSGFQFFLIRPALQMNTSSTSFFDRIRHLLGEVERLWVPILLPGDIQHPEAWLTPNLNREQAGRRVGLIYMGN